jgi:DNA replication and repair protein RecF
MLDLGAAFIRGDSNHPSKRIIKENGKPLKKRTALLEVIRVIWLTPQMDGLFLDTPSERRKFLDRICYNFYPNHADVVSAYETCMRSRTKVLSEHYQDPIWLNNLEAQMAETAIEIAKHRLKSIKLLRKHLKEFTSDFVRPDIAIEGKIEEIILAGELDDGALLEMIKQELCQARKLDQKMGRCSFGVHKSDLIAIHPTKKMVAGQSSTGEQKAMLISLMLAQTRAVNEELGIEPVLLLDDIFSHLDTNRRRELITEISKLQSQAWITTNNISFLEEIDGKNILL